MCLCLLKGMISEGKNRDYVLHCNALYNLVSNKWSFNLLMLTLSFPFCCKLKYSNISYHAHSYTVGFGLDWMDELSFIRACIQSCLVDIILRNLLINPKLTLVVATLIIRFEPHLTQSIPHTKNKKAWTTTVQLFDALTHFICSCSLLQYLSKIHFSLQKSEVNLLREMHVLYKIIIIAGVIVIIIKGKKEYNPLSYFIPLPVYLIFICLQLLPGLHFQS